MTRVLFVDDEPNVLDGLRRNLRRERHEWEMHFVESGLDALALCESRPFDVVVSDMRMPGMSGAALLEKIAGLHPETIRIVLSGHSETESALRAVHVAHQFLTKPCEPKRLREVVCRALELERRLSDEKVRQVVGRIESLPMRPETYTAMTSALSDPEVEMETISSIVENDIAISAKLLQIVNSSFFGLARSITDVRHATNVLGLDAIRDLVLSIETFRPPDDAPREVGAFIDRLQRRSLWIARVAARLLDDRARSPLAFTAGMLHDVGLLVLATQMPERLGDSISSRDVFAREQWEAERAAHEVTHAEIGAYLLGVWGLPYPILEAAAYHHNPCDLSQDTFSELSAVHVAIGLVDASMLNDAAVDPRDLMDAEYLDQLELADRIPEWVEMAEDLRS